MALMDDLLRLMNPPIRPMVQPMDASADQLIRDMLAGPHAIPSYAAVYEAAARQPQPVFVYTTDDPNFPALGRYSHRQGHIPPTIDVRVPGPPMDYGQLAPATGSPHSVGWTAPSMATPEHTLAHELSHFLSQMYGINTPGPAEERLAQYSAGFPIDPALLRVAYQSHQRTGQPMTPFWRLVQRQMEGTMPSLP